MVCRDFILPESANYVCFFPFFFLRNLFYLIWLLATKGHPQRRAKNIHQVIISPVEEHSKKPEEARRRIEALLGEVPRLELFARRPSPGWDVWGNEVESNVVLGS